MYHFCSHVCLLYTFSVLKFTQSTIYSCKMYKMSFVKWIYPCEKYLPKFPLPLMNPYPPDQYLLYLLGKVLLALQRNVSSVVSRWSVTKESIRLNWLKMFFYFFPLIIEKTGLNSTFQLWTCLFLHLYYQFLFHEFKILFLGT